MNSVGGGGGLKIYRPDLRLGMHDGSCHFAIIGESNVVRIFLPGQSNHPTTQDTEHHQKRQNRPNIPKLQLDSPTYNNRRVPQYRVPENEKYTMG